MDFNERVRALAEAAGITSCSPDQCWVDARVRCPYGLPEGQYVLRPTLFCDDRCPSFPADLEEIINEAVEELKPDAVREHFEMHQVTVTSELGARAEEFPLESPERLALELAASILEDHNLDRDILLKDDVPGAK